jgi:hypothetical protein
MLPQGLHACRPYHLDDMQRVATEGAHETVRLTNLDFSEEKYGLFSHVGSIRKTELYVALYF